MSEDARRVGGGPRYEVYHLGVAESCLVRESPQWICDEMGVSRRLEFGTGSRGWIGHSPFVLLDVRKARRAATGPSPAPTLR